MKTYEQDADPSGEIVYIQVGATLAVDKIRKMHAAVGPTCEKIEIDQSSQVVAGVNGRIRVEGGGAGDGLTSRPDADASRAVITMAREILARGPETLRGDIGEKEGWGSQHWQKAQKVKEWPETWSHRLLEEAKEVGRPDHAQENLNY